MKLTHVLTCAVSVAYAGLLGCERSAMTGSDARDEHPAVTLTRLNKTLIAGRGFNCQLGSAGELGCWGRGRPIERGMSFGSATHLAVGSIWRDYEVHTEPMCWLFPDGTFACNRPAPTLDPAIHVALGSERGCAVVEGGGVMCWRLDGEAAPDRYEVPGAVAVAVAEAHACALTEHGRVDCWGFDECPPRHIAAFGVGVDISARVDTCVIDRHGDVRCLDPIRCPEPTTALSSVQIPTAAHFVATGYEVNCASSTSLVTCWPSSVASSGSPRLARVVEFPESMVIRELSVGAEHACVRSETGTIECWGSNRNHQLDPDAGSTLVSAPRVVTGIQQAEQVVVGDQRSCARTTKGNVSCWGAAWDADDPLPWTGSPRPVPRLAVAALFADPMRGKLGFVSVDGSLEYWPREPDTPFEPVFDEALARGGRLRVERTNLDARALLACVIPDTGPSSCASSPPLPSATTWPRHLFDDASDIALCLDQGWLVDGGRLRSVRLSADPKDWQSTLVELPSAVVDVACSSFEVCARLEDGSVSCWSDPRSSDPLYSHTPGPIPLEDPARGLTMGLRTACSWGAEGRVECWGDPSAPSLAPFSHAERRSPDVLASLRGVTQAAIDFTHGCAVHEGGTVSCWGQNTEGQAGLGAGAWRDAPEDARSSLLTSAAAKGAVRGSSSSYFPPADRMGL